MNKGDVIAVLIPATVVAIGKEGDAPTSGPDNRRTVLAAVPQPHLGQYTVYEDETVLFDGAKIAKLEPLAPASSPAEHPASTETQVPTK